MSQGFEAVHDRFIKDWNYAMKTGDTVALENLTETYYVAYFYEPADKPSFLRKKSL